MIPLLLGLAQERCLLVPSCTSPHEETVQEVALLKEQVSELMHMIQQLVMEGGLNSSDHSQGGPQTENENQPLPV